jgi:hypothetical protein
VSLGGGGHHSASGLTLKGLYGWLPFDRVDDKGLLGAMAKAVTGKVNYLDTNHNYVLLKINSMDFLMDFDLFKLVKRVYSKFGIILFESSNSYAMIFRDELKYFCKLYQSFDEFCVDNNMI